MSKRIYTSRHKYTVGDASTSTVEAATQTYMELSEALTTIRRAGVFLHYDAERGLDLWTPGVKVPITLRRSVVKHRKQLLAMMHAAHPRVCPTYLHAFHWVLYHSTNRYICEMCETIEPTDHRPL